MVSGGGVLTKLGATMFRLRQSVMISQKMVTRSGGRVMRQVMCCVLVSMMCGVSVVAHVKVLLFGVRLSIPRLAGITLTVPRGVSGLTFMRLCIVSRLQVVSNYYFVFY